MFSIDDLKKKLLNHYKDPNRVNKYPIQLAEEHKVPLPFITQANWELLQECEVELKDITG